MNLKPTLKILVVFLLNISTLLAMDDTQDDMFNPGYETVELVSHAKIPRADRLVTKHLAPCAFPILPAGHRWVKEGGEYVVKKHKLAPYVPIEICVYADDEHNPTSVNYVTLFDNVNVQSYAHTRPTTSTFQGHSGSYSLTVQQAAAPYALRSHGALMQYLDGHCIDNADTSYPEVVHHVNSSIDIPNHIPEPYNTHWGKYHRRVLVQSLRPSKGSYMQLPYYSLNPLRTNIHNIPVPDGVHFIVYPQDSYSGPLSFPQYQVPWNHWIHNPNQVGTWETLLPHLLVDRCTYGYLPNIAGLDGSNSQWWLNELNLLIRNSPITNNTYTHYDPRLSYCVMMAADREESGIDWKIRYLHYSCVTRWVTPETIFWNHRALTHAELLLEYDLFPYEKKQLNEIFDIMRCSGEALRDHWHQMLSDSQELGKTRIDFPPDLVPIQGKPRLYVLPPQFVYTTVKQEKAYVGVMFKSGPSSIKAIQNAPPHDIGEIQRLGQIWLQNADALCVKNWLEVNKDFEKLDKTRVIVFYSPRKGKSSWDNIEQSLTDAKFIHIRRVT